MEDRLQLKKSQSLDLTTDREMKLNYATITTKTIGVALVVSNGLVNDHECKKSLIHENSKKLCEFLLHFDYFVHHRQNITKQEFMRLCKRLAEYKYPSNCKRLVVAFSGYGIDGVLQLRDGGRIFLEDVLCYFKSTNTTLLGSMIRLFFVDTHYMSPVTSLIQDGNAITKASDFCRFLSRIEKDANLLVAYSTLSYCDQYSEHFNLHGKWTSCLADELLVVQSQFASLQSVLTKVNEAMVDIATEAKCFHTVDYCFSPDELFILPSSDTTVAVSLPITQLKDDKLNLDSFRADNLLLTRPQLKHLVEHITPSYAPQWKTLGILLDLPLGILEMIEYNCPTDCGECCNRMLTEWHERDTTANWQKILSILDSSAIRKPSTDQAILYEDTFAACNMFLMRMMNIVSLIQTKWSLIGKQLQIPDSILNKISEECHGPSKDTQCCIKMFNELVKANKNITLSEFLQVFITPFVGLAKDSSSIEQCVKDITCLDQSSNVQDMNTAPGAPDKIDRKFALMIAKVVKHLNDSNIDLDLLIHMLAHYRGRGSQSKIEPKIYQNIDSISDLISSLQDNGYISHTDLSWLKFLVEDNCHEALEVIKKYEEDSLVADMIKWTNKPNYKHQNGTYLVAVTKSQPENVTCKVVNETKSIAAQMVGLEPTDIKTETGAIGSVHFHWRILFISDLHVELPSTITAEKKQACIKLGVLKIGILTEHKSEFVVIEDLAVTKAIGHYTLILTGCVGSGKSKACNFFLKREVFQSKRSFKSVTTGFASCTDKVGGKYIKFIDTKGFFDPYSSIIAKEFEELAKGIIEISDGVDAIGFVINLESRITKEDVNLLEKLLENQSMIPYIFLIFTHAKGLGETEKVQQQNIEELLKNDCPEVLQRLVRNVNGRFILLESVEPMQEGYQDKKSRELLDILQKLVDQNKQKFVFGKLTEHLKELNDQDKIEVLKNDLNVIKQQLINRQQMDEPRSDWGTIFTLITESFAKCFSPPTHSELLSLPSERSLTDSLSFSSPQLLPVSSVYNSPSFLSLSPQLSPVTSVLHYNSPSFSSSFLNPSLFQSQSSSNLPLDLFNPYSPANLSTTHDFLNKHH